MTQRVSHKPIKCQSRSWSQSGTKVKESHHGDSPLLKPRGIQIETKSLPDSTTREHRKLIGVKTVALGTNTRLLSGVLPAYQNLSYKLQRGLSDVLPTQERLQRLSDVLPIQQSKVINSEANIFPIIGIIEGLGGSHEEKLCDTLQGMTPSNVKTVHQTSLLHIESNPDRLGIVVAYPRP